MVTASVSRRVWVTLTRVSAAPTRSFTRYRAPSHRLVSLIEKIPSSFSEEQLQLFSRVHALFTLTQGNYTSYVSFPTPPFPPPFFVFDGTRFVRFSISRQKSAKENFYVEKVCFQNLNQRWTILFKISIENYYERY